MHSPSLANHSGLSAKCRDTKVEELLGLTSFFGYSTQTFVQSVNLLDRFLTIMKISDGDLLNRKELVAKCMSEYCSSECFKPENKKLVWIVSRRAAANLQENHFSVLGLPTIPEGSWDEIESEDSCEGMNCEEDSPWGSPGSESEGAFFPSAF